MTAAADIDLGPDLLRAMKVHASASAVWRWMSDRYEQLLALGRIGNWMPICEALTAAGVRNAKGAPLTTGVISRVWSRLKLARSRADGEQGSLLPTRTSERRATSPIETASAEPQQPSASQDRAPPLRLQTFLAPSRSPAPVSMRADDPPMRSKEEVRAILRFSGQMMEVKYKKSNGYYREAREQQAALIAEARALGMEHELPPLVFKDGE